MMQWRTPGHCQRHGRWRRCKPGIRRMNLVRRQKAVDFSSIGHSNLIWTDRMINMPFGGELDSFAEPRLQRRHRP